MTQLRIGRSLLNDHSFPLGLSSSPQCLCHAPRESSGHILPKCFIYTREHLTLFSKVDNLLPKFNNFTKKRKVEVLLYGLYPDNPDFYQINKSLQIAIQHYLISIKGFDYQ